MVTRLENMYLTFIAFLLLDDSYSAAFLACTGLGLAFSTSSRIQEMDSSVVSG